jgi:hypothetical protein
MSVIIILDVLNFSADQNSISCFYGWFSTLTGFFSELPKDSKCGFFNDHIPYKPTSERKLKAVNRKQNQNKTRQNNDQKERNITQTKVPKLYTVITDYTPRSSL